MAVLVQGQVIDTVLFTPLGAFQFPYSVGTISQSAYSCKLDRMGRPYAYVCCRELGLVTFDISDPLMPVPTDTLAPAQLSGLAVNNVEQDGALLYLSVGGFEGTAQYAGLATVDVNDPEAPVVLDVWYDTQFQNGAAIAQVQDDVAYLGAMDDGVVVLDVSDPLGIGFLSSFQPDPGWPGIVSYAPQARGMAVRDTVLYLAYDAGAFRTIDIRDPYALAQLGQYVNPDHPLFTPNATNNVVLKGDHAILTYDFCGIEVVDISDPTDPQQESWTNPWNCGFGTWFGSDGHTNELMLVRNDSLLFVSGGDSELLVYDATQLPALTLVGANGPPNDSTATWGLDVLGDRVIGCYLNNSFIAFPPQPFHANWGGVRLFDWQLDITTRITDRSGTGAIALYPNPARDQVLVQWRLGASPDRYQLQDMMGRLVRSGPVVADAGAAAMRLDLSNLSDGTYAFDLTGSDMHRVARLIVANGHR